MIGHRLVAVLATTKKYSASFHHFNASADSVHIIGRKGGQKQTAAPRLTVEITTAVQMPDSDDESQLP